MHLHLLKYARIAALAMLVACAIPGTASPATQGCDDDTSGVTDLTSTWETELLSLTNAHRTGMGLATLQLDATLTKASAWKARDMARRNYFQHDDPANGAAPARSPWDRLSACGWTGSGSRAENIAAGYSTPQQTITGWLNSAGHRANIENAAMRYVGFGVASSTTSSYGTYEVQMFSSVAGPTSSTPTAPAPPTARSLTLVAGDAPRVLCPVTGTTFVLDTVAGQLDASVAADGCLTIAARSGAGGSTATIAYRARATATGATSTPVDLVIAIEDRDRSLLDEDDGATGGGGASTRASRISVTSARLARSRCTGSWAVRGWCWRLVIQGRVLLDDHSTSAGRSVVVSRMTSARRLALVGRTTTNAAGTFSISARVRPSARSTSTWLARNATRIRIGATPTATATAGVAWASTRTS